MMAQCGQGYLNLYQIQPADAAQPRAKFREIQRGTSKFFEICSLSAVLAVLKKKGNPYVSDTIKGAAAAITAAERNTDGTAAGNAGNQSTLERPLPGRRQRQGQGHNLPAMRQRRPGRTANLTEKPNSRNHFLKCWNGGCSFETGGSVIDLYMMENGMNPQTDFSRAVDELAARLNISIDPHRNSTAAEDFAEAAPAAGNPSFSGEPSSTAAAEPNSRTAREFPEILSAMYEEFAGIVEAQAYLRAGALALAAAASLHWR